MSDTVWAHIMRVHVGDEATGRQAIIMRGLLQWDVLFDEEPPGYPPHETNPQTFLTYQCALSVAKRYVQTGLRAAEPEAEKQFPAVGGSWRRKAAKCRESE